jgi:hypothetical protein
LIRKKEEGRRKKEEGRRKKEEGRRKKEEVIYHCCRGGFTQIFESHRQMIKTRPHPTHKSMIN